MSRVLRRLLNWVLWHTRLLPKMRRDLYLHPLGKPAVGEVLTVFDEESRPCLAEVLGIDQWGVARLMREDGVIVERVVA
jgi:hypothetical protein